MIEVTPVLAYNVSYEDAVMFCFCCNYNGYTDWRLPSILEYFGVAAVDPGCWVTGKQYWTTTRSVQLVRGYQELSIDLENYTSQVIQHD